MHVDMHAMWINPEGANPIYCGNDGGMYKSTNGGYSWSVMENMTNTQFYAIEIHPRVNYFLYGGTQDNGTMRSTSPDKYDW